jgi:ubiquitin-protein ligase
MNSDKQEDSILVDSTVRMSSTSSTTDGIGRLLVSDDADHHRRAVVGGGAPRADDVGGGGGGASSPPRVDDIASNGVVGRTTTAVFDDNGNAVGGGNSGGDDDDIVDDVVVDDEDDIDIGDQDEDDQDDDDDDDESDYSYAYDDEDDGHFSGFLIPTDQFEVVAPAPPPPPGRVNVVVAEDLASGSGGGMAMGTGMECPRSSSSSGPTPAKEAFGPSSSTSGGDDVGHPHIPLPHARPVIPETRPREEERKQKWREPTRAAVNMSLRAEKEKTGGRRRLASDLYKIMSADTQEAGFSLQPCDEDSMEKWCIKLFGFDEDSNLAKDLLVCGMDHVELRMTFPEQYPFEPPFVRVVKPRFKRQTGFVMSGALCMELLTKDGWNPINDIESVIVSIRSLMVVGDGRLQAAVDMSEADYARILKCALGRSKILSGGEGTNDSESAELDEEEGGDPKAGEAKRKRESINDISDGSDAKSKASSATRKPTGGSYTDAEAQSAYDHLSKYHKQEGWDKSGWWSRKG